MADHNDILGSARPAIPGAGPLSEAISGFEALRPAAPRADSALGGRGSGESGTDAESIFRPSMALNSADDLASNEPPMPSHRIKGLDFLTPRAQARLAGILDRDADLGALTYRVYSRYLELGEIAANHTREIRRLDSEKRQAIDERVKAMTLDQQIDREREKLARVEAEQKKINGELERRQESRQPVAAGIEKVKIYLRRLMDNYRVNERPLSDFDLDTLPALSIDEAQAEVDRLRAELHRVKCAPIPSVEAKRIARQKIEVLAEAGQPDVLRTVEIGAAPTWSPLALIENRGLTEPERNLGLAAVAWLNRDAMIAAMEAEIDRHADDDNALTDAQRVKALEKTEAALLAAQIAEVEAVNREHGNFFYRPKTDARAILAVQGPVF